MGLADFLDDGGNRRRILGHLHFTQQRLDLGGLAGETDAEQLAHRTAAAVAPDEVARAQVRAVRQLDGHPVLVLAQPDHFAAAPDLGTEFEGTLVEQPLGDRLRGGEAVRVRRVQPVRPRLHDAAEETADLELLTDREEPVQQAALVHHLDAARVQALPAGLLGRLGQLLQHDHVHSGQPQLAGQHQAGRSAADHDHVNHESPHSTRLDFGQPLRAVRRHAHPHLRAESPQQHGESHRRFDVPAQPIRRQKQMHFANP